MSAFTGPFSWATHSPNTGTSCTTTSATSTSGGGACGGAAFSLHAVSARINDKSAVLLATNKIRGCHAFTDCLLNRNLSSACTVELLRKMRKCYQNAPSKVRAVTRSGKLTEVTVWFTPPVI